MIYLLTGQPGNGKTLRAMWLMESEYNRNQQAVKDGKEQPRRFFTNVAGATTDENPEAFPWVEKLPDHNDWTQLPDGSFVVYDEAHSDGSTPGLERYGRLFPSTGKPGESDDPRIRAMSTHRHRGFDLVMVTQYPSKIHHQVRTLVGEHIHMNRAMGLQRAGVLKWTRVQSDPYDERQREKAEEEIWAYEKGLYSRYKSTVLHTASYKFRVPKKVWGALARVLMLFVVGWLLWLFVFKPDAPAAESEAEEGGPVLALAPAGAGEPATPVDRGDDYMAYMERITPRFRRMPWSAPIYDDREAVAKPELYCMASDPGIDAHGRERPQSCSCFTEQGTRYQIRNVDCRAIARNGPEYNPFREPSQDASYSQAQPPVAVPEPVSSPMPGVALSGPQVAAYGDMGERDITTADVGEW